MFSGEAGSAWLSPASLGHCMSRGVPGQGWMERRGSQHLSGPGTGWRVLGGWSGAPHKLGVPSMEAREGRAGVVGDGRL